LYKERSIVTVVPAHNEERHIADVIATTPDFVDHIVVVDDCSQDATSAVAGASGDPRVVILKTPSNQGVGGAVILGYRKAIELGGDLIVKMDGDGQMIPEYLSKLLDPLIEEGYGYSKGNRFLASDSLQQMPSRRLIGNIGLTFMTKLSSGYWHIFDPQNGYTAITAEMLRAIDLDRVHTRYFFENDILINLNFRNVRVKDVPIPARYGDEASDMNLVRIGLTFPVLLGRRYLRRIFQKYVLRDFSPIALFLIVGALLFSWGAIFGAYIWIHSYLTQHPTTTGTIMLSLLPLILGFQLLLQAFVMDIQETPR
jgi:glycosyltransferase involved in cell wall biosynthesis